MGLTGPLPTTRVAVHIDELALDGFERIDRDQVAAAFQRELARLLRRHITDGANATGLAASGGATSGGATSGGHPAGEAPLAAASDHAYDGIFGLTLRLPPAASARRLGIELARAVHAGLTRPGQAAR
ncbi:MAG TPA: hypothetical protein VFU43_30125 [Streptosporangiaceae bacterium]|nr:hypothetical protein [Streptosporangiaceae bacterium]